MSTGPSVGDLDAARRRADDKRRSFAQATEALKAKVETETEEVTALVVRARSTARTADEAVRKYRWVAIGAAVALGAAVGRRRRPRALPAGENVVYVQPRPKKRSMFGSLLGAVATAAAKKIALAVVESMNRPEDD